MQSKKTVTVNDLSLRNAARNVNSEDEAKIIIGEFKRSGLVKTFVLSNTEQAEDFISFLKTFWDWEISPYIHEKLRRSHGIHKMHCLKQEQGIARYWEPFFKGRFLGEITAQDIDSFITHMGTLNISASRKNVVIMAGTKPLRWAFSKGKIEADPTRGHILFSKKTRKRSILTPTAAAAIFRTVWNDGRAKLANMLASVTGMRSGEILALRFQDIGADCLYVGGSWNRVDKDKLPKNNETRTVEIPFPVLINGLVELAKQNPWGVSPDSFIFWSVNKKGIPMRGQRFVDELRTALVQIGFSNDDAARYDFHCWRHFFTSYMIKKLDKKLLKGETGHLTDTMIDLYSDHEIEGDKALIQTTKKETFAGLLPQNLLLLEDKKNQKITAT